MTITKRVLDWTDKKMDEVVSNPEEKHANLKAFVLGAIEGTIDGAVIAYPFLIVSLFVAGSQIKKLKG